MPKRLKLEGQIETRGRKSNATKERARSLTEEFALQREAAARRGRAAKRRGQTIEEYLVRGGKDVSVKKIGTGSRPYVPYVNGEPVKTRRGRVRRFGSEKNARAAGLAYLMGK